MKIIIVLAFVAVASAGHLGLKLHASRIFPLSRLALPPTPIRVSYPIPAHSPLAFSAPFPAPIPVPAPIEITHPVQPLPFPALPQPFALPAPIEITHPVRPLPLPALPQPALPVPHEFSIPALPALPFSTLESIQPTFENVHKPAETYGVPA